MAAISAFLVDLDDTLAAEHDYVLSGYRAVAACLAEETGAEGAAVLARLRYEFFKFGRVGAFDRLYKHFGWTAGGNAPSIPDLVTVYREHRPSLAFYDGAEAALAQLRARAPVAIVTDGAEAMQARKAQALGLYAKTDAVILCDSLGKAKPDPAGYHAALETLGADAASALVIGDDPFHDLEAARRLGSRAIRVRTGRLASLETPEPWSGTEEYASFAAAVDGLLK
ncbi:MAG: HAD-IA family hydrolase [Alphaproteobacteria bacterium]|nr:HAD-IA family hydrolase [Alphaproteobacteria bacterium]